MTEFKIPKVSAETIMGAVEGIYFKNGSGLSVDGISTYLGISKEYARRAAIVAMEFNMILEVNSKYKITQDAVDIGKSTREQWPVIFGKFLQKFKPFTLFVTFLGKNETPENASRKIKTIFEIKASEKIIENSLSSWGQYAKILEEKNSKIILSLNIQNLSNEYVTELKDAIVSDVKARTFLVNKLGNDVYNYLESDETDLLVKSIVNHEINPRHSIDDSGRAYEDFLRRIGTDKSFDMSEFKGIGELTDNLKGNKLIEIKHLEISKAINQMRLTAAHNKDRKTVQNWTLKDDTSIACILLTLTAIRSIYQFIFNNQQIL